MYKKILVCLDGSELAEQVLPYAAEVAKRFDSALILLRVLVEPVLVSPGIPGVGGMPIVTSRMGKQVEIDERQAEDYLQSIAARLLKDYAVKAEIVTSLGAAGPTIVNYSAANGIELIAIATHGRTGPGRALFGSVADFVVRQSSLPVLLIRPTAAK